MSDQPCPVELIRTALRHHWREAEHGPRAARALLAQAARLATQVAVGTAAAGQLAALDQVAVQLEALDHPAGRLLTKSLRREHAVWQAHVERSECGAGICFRRPTPPCQAACPANLDIPSFIADIGHHRYDEAVQVIVQDNPLPMTCGLVCPAPCETACLRGQTTGEPLFIRPMKAVASRQALKRFGGYHLPERAPATGKRIAVVGSGPAGLAASYFLAVRGHRVDIFEEQEDAGGMLRYGIPAYRLPPELLDIELAQIERLGVAIHTSHRIDDLDGLRTHGFDAVLVAPGFQLSRLLPFPGSDLPIVKGGMDFLRAVRSGLDPHLQGRIVVIGGGNVAIDVALTAARQGASQVTMVCLEARHEMPASRSEIDVALAEGISIQNGWGPLEATADGHITFQQCTRVFDADGRFAPSFEPKRQLGLDADVILLAVGQSLDARGIDASGIEIRRGLLATDPATLQTREIGIFASGDAAHGPRTVVAAVRAGKQAAASIDAWLRHEAIDPHWSDPQQRDHVEPLAVAASARSRQPRHPMPELPLDQRQDYRQIELGLSQADADEEAGRCLRCDMCIGCGLCQLACSEVGAEALRMEETSAGRLVFKDFERPSERCIGCGACAQVCPTGAISIADVDGVRNTVITGTVVKSQALLACDRCGQPFQSAAQRSLVAGRVGAQAEAHFRQRLCPACARQAQARERLGVSAPA